MKLNIHRTKSEYSEKCAGKKQVAFEYRKINNIILVLYRLNFMVGEKNYAKFCGTYGNFSIQIEQVEGQNHQPENVTVERNVLQTGTKCVFSGHLSP